MHKVKNLIFSGGGVILPGAWNFPCRRKCQIGCNCTVFTLNTKTRSLQDRQCDRCVSKSNPPRTQGWLTVVVVQTMWEEEDHVCPHSWFICPVIPADNAHIQRNSSWVLEAEKTNHLIVLHLLFHNWNGTPYPSSLSQSLAGGWFGLFTECDLWQYLRGRGCK